MVNGRGCDHYRTLKAMVLVYQPELSHSVWMDFRSGARSRKGLERQLKQGIREGRWVSWRLIFIEKEVMGDEKQ